MCFPFVVDVHLCLRVVREKDKRGAASEGIKRRACWEKKDRLSVNEQAWDRLIDELCFA